MDKQEEVFGKNSAGGGAGRWELVGGAGKCLYDAKYLPGNHLVATGDCTWKT